MVFLPNYSFDFHHGGHNKQSYTPKKVSVKLPVNWFFASKSGHSQESKVFLNFPESCYL